MKHILVATDGSPPAAKAMDLAVDLARLYEAKLSIVHVTLHERPSGEVRRMAESEGLTRPATGPEAAHANIPAEMIEVLNETRESKVDADVVEALGNSLLARAKARAEQAGVGEVDTRLAEGDTAGAIVDTAEDLGADAVVLGSRGLGDLKGLLMGSVSHEVASKAGCTCITVR